MMNNRFSINDKEQEETLAIGQHGVTAKLSDENVIVSNREGTELFRFNAQACPFKEQPIRFLVEIYTVGLQRGKLIGREIVKARIYELLGPEF
jgi:hypothetical protein